MASLFRRRKAISPLIAGVLYFAIAVAGVTIVVQTGTPALTKMKDVAAIDQAKDTISNLDRIISLVSEEGRGSARVIPLQIKKGDIVVSPETDTISYEIDTQAEVVSPRTRKQIGSLLFASGASVSAYNTTSSWVIENEHLRVNITKNGTASSFAPLSTPSLVRGVYFKDGSVPVDGTVYISVDDNPLSESGMGYTYAEALGSGLSRGRVVAHMNTTDAEYNVYFTLQSGSDFLEIYVGEYMAH